MCPVSADDTPQYAHRGGARLHGESHGAGCEKTHARGRRHQSQDWSYFGREGRRLRVAPPPRPLLYARAGGNAPPGAQLFFARSSPRGGWTQAPVQRQPGRASVAPPFRAAGSIQIHCDKAGSLSDGACVAPVSCPTLECARPEIRGGISQPPTQLTANVIHRLTWESS
jgi:hypothetical protein